MCCCHNRWHITAAITVKNILSSSFQPSFLSAEPLLPPHNFHSHSLRRLPLYQPLHISQPMPVSLSVGQPTLPRLPAHHRVLPAHTSISPPRVPPFLSLPRQQSSYRADQVCLMKTLINTVYRSDLHFILTQETINCPVCSLYLVIQSLGILLNGNLFL